MHLLPHPWLNRACSSGAGSFLPQKPGWKACVRLPLQLRQPVFPGCTTLLLLRLAVLTALLLPWPPLTPLQVLCWDAGTYLWDPVLAAIVALFRQLDDFEEERQAAAAALLSGAPPPLPLLMDAEQQQKRAVIDPTPLREALNALPGQEFKMGEQWRRGLTGGLLACCCDGWPGACGGFLTAEWHCCCCCWLLCVCC